MSETSQDFLVLFCRRPLPGVGKRRIAADLGDADTAELAELLLATAQEDAEAWPGRVALSPSTERDLVWAKGLLDRACEVIAQPDSQNLGERILRVDRELRARGADRVFFIGSDAPLLGGDDYRAARTALDRADVVLAPATDGGVTLMGAGKPWPADLPRLPWSTSELGDSLANMCEQVGLSVARLSESSDVDRAADLPRLHRELERDERRARQRLREWLGMRVSIVIPVFGDREELRRLLGSLERGSRVETIVVDGQGDPDCQQLCEQRGCRYLRTTAGRGHQLRFGAAHATGAILWFLHADSEPPPEGVALLRAAVERGAGGGCFPFRFAGSRSFGKRLLERFVALRNRLGGIPYGDQGLFFTRQVYDAAGGFADQPLFEEVPLVRSARGQGTFALLTEPIRVSPRRWERDGWVRRTLENRVLALGYAAGVSPETLARRYRK